MNRRGFTLVELLVGTVVMAVLGVALIRMMVSDSRFVSRQDAMMSARQVSRGAMNMIAPELRMITDGALAMVTPKGLTARIPYAFGMTCQEVGSGTIAATLVPTDSLRYANATPGGMAWRDSTGTYLAVDGVFVSAHSNPADCLADSIFTHQIPGASLIQISGFGGGFMVYGEAMMAGPGGVMPPPGQIFYLYELVTYVFATSVELPGRIALWRGAGFMPPQELLAPFDTSAGFGCLVGDDLAVQTCPPAGGLAEVRGLELRLVGASDVAPRGTTDPVTFDLITRVPFLNKVN